MHDSMHDSHAWQMRNTESILRKEAVGKKYQGIRITGLGAQLEGGGGPTEAQKASGGKHCSVPKRLHTTNSTLVTPAAPRCPTSERPAPPSRRICIRKHQHGIHTPLDFAMRIKNRDGLACHLDLTYKIIGVITAGTSGNTRQYYNITYVQQALKSSSRK